MIKYDSDNLTVTIEGTVRDLVNDSMMMARIIYESLCSKDKFAGESYKNLMITCIPDTFLPEEDLKKKSEEKYQEAKKMIEEMQGMVNHLREMHENIGEEMKSDEDFQDDFHKWLYSQESED